MSANTQQNPKQYVSDDSLRFRTSLQNNSPQKDMSLYANTFALYVDQVLSESLIKTQDVLWKYCRAFEVFEISRLGIEITGAVTIPL